MDLFKNLRRLFEDDRSGLQTPAPDGIDHGPAVPAALDPLLSDDGLPPKCREAAVALRAELRLLSARASARSVADAAVMEIASLLDVHLPDLLRRYLDVPAEHRAEIFRRTGRSASFHLSAAIDVMSRRAKEISLVLASGPIDDFATGTRFVETRYGHEHDPFA